MALLEQLIFICFIVATSGENCEKLGINLYEDLRCTPTHTSSQQCPVKYTCQGLEPSPPHCFFKGRSYAERERVDDNLADLSCNRACFCSTVANKKQFTCAVLDCPEWLGMPLTEGCYRKYDVNLCCSTGEVCPPFDKLQKCTVEGKVYQEGQRFWPKETCLTCVCQKGFNGQFVEPHCRRMACVDQLKRFKNVNHGCAPFYDHTYEKVSCCPGQWICADGAEVVEGAVKKDEKCTFGSKVLKVGQLIRKVNVETLFGKKIANVKCECVVPPLLICTEA